MKTTFFLLLLVIVFHTLKWLWILETKNRFKHIINCAEYDIIAHFNRSFLLTWTPKTMTHVITLLVLTWAKPMSNPIENFQHPIDWWWALSGNRRLYYTLERRVGAAVASSNSPSISQSLFLSIFPFHFIPFSSTYCLDFHLVASILCLRGASRSPFYWLCL